jgi:uncharacterized integral membrane protein
VSQQGSGKTGQGRRPAVSPKYVIAGLVGVLALVFVFQNAEQAGVQLFFWQVTAPGWVWLLGLFLAGVAVGSFFPWLRRRK